LSVVRQECTPTSTTLIGALDQSALRGVLIKIWDLNLTLLSVVPLQESEVHELMQGGDDE
jgi:hypothetical protein